MATVCGLGTWSGPLPGDPDVNSSVLSAVPAFGGVDVSWLYPGLNAHAVAHTLLFRGTTNNFGAAIQRAVVSGNFFYDKADANQIYFYWIKIVSVHGTVGGLIGPASAAARPLIADLIDQLSGQINDSFLGQALKTKLDKITLNYNELTAEITARMASETVVSVAYSNLTNDVAQTMAYIGNEITTRANGDDALAQQMTTLAAVNATNAAAITTERTARVTAESATATAIDTLRVATNTSISNLTNANGTNSAAIIATAAAINTESVTRTNADSALANNITTVQSTFTTNILDVNNNITATNTNMATVRTELQTNINSLDGKVNAIGAAYTVKLDVNGLVAGFGLYNTGATTSAGFNVNTFYIGDSTVSYVPFIVTGGQVFIKDAAIEKLTFSKLRDEAGSFIVENGKVKTNYIETRGLILRDGSGNAIFGAGTALSVDFITGLGALSTQDNVAYAALAGAKPPINADNTASNNSAGFAGQGSLATLNEVKLGHNVTFPDGNIIHSGDLVSRLSKINTGTISTFMDGAAITNAYIGNLAVSTLKIQDNAVTIPLGAIGLYSASVSTVVPAGEVVTFHMIGTFTQGNFRHALVVRLLVNGQSVTFENPRDVTLGAMSWQVTIFGNGYTATQFAIAADDATGDMRCGLLVLGVKK